jgi:protein phosphatase
MRSYLSVEPDPFPAAVPAPSRLVVRAAARTDRGLERDNNEDRAAFADLGSLSWEAPAAAEVASKRAFVALVCDGMGGEAGGEIASGLAVETILPFLHAASATDLRGEGAVACALVASIEAASSRIKAEAARDPRLTRMGTTATLAAVVDGDAGGALSLVCAQVGDSRAYLKRGETLVQLTRDQTMAELLRRNAPLPDGPLGIGEIVGANIILQAVGSSTRLDVAITHTALEKGDTLLLCSDGLSGVVDDPAIAGALTAEPTPDRACAALIALALAAGAPDNVTCIVFRIG